jgi:hypothetical protein
MLINLSNHPTSTWTEQQLATAKTLYQKIHDIPFPPISPEMSELQITDLAQTYVKQIIALKPTAVHIMGEMNFVHKCVTLLKMYDIKCIASTSERESIEDNGTKLSTFRFIQFREY